MLAFQNSWNERVQEVKTTCAHPWDTSIEVLSMEEHSLLLWVKFHLKFLPLQKTNRFLIQLTPPLLWWCSFIYKCSFSLSVFSDTQGTPSYINNMFQFWMMDHELRTQQILIVVRERGSFYHNENFANLFSFCSIVDSKYCSFALR